MKRSEKNKKQNKSRNQVRTIKAPDAENNDDFEFTGGFFHKYNKVLTIAALALVMIVFGLGPSIGSMLAPKAKQNTDISYYAGKAITEFEKQTWLRNLSILTGSSLNDEVFKTYRNALALNIGYSKKEVENWLKDNAKQGKISVPKLKQSIYARGLNAISLNESIGALIILGRYESLVKLSYTPILYDAEFETLKENIEASFQVAYIPTGELRADIEASTGDLIKEWHSEKRKSSPATYLYKEQRYNAEALLLEYKDFWSDVKEGKQYDASEIEVHYRQKQEDFKFKLPEEKKKTENAEKSKDEAFDNFAADKPLYKEWDSLSGVQKAEVKKSFILNYFKNPSSNSKQHPLRNIEYKLEDLSEKLNDKNYTWAKIPTEELKGVKIHFKYFKGKTKEEIEKALAVTDLKLSANKVFGQQYLEPNKKAWIRFRLTKILPLKLKAYTAKEVQKQLTENVIDTKLNEKITDLKEAFGVAIEKAVDGKNTVAEKQKGFEKGAKDFANKKALKGIKISLTEKRNLRKYRSEALGIHENVNFNELKNLAIKQKTYALSDVNVSYTDQGIWIAWLTDVRIPEGEELDAILKEDTAKYVFQLAAIPLDSVKDAAAKLVTTEQIAKRYKIIVKKSLHNVEYLDGEMRYNGYTLSADIDAIIKNEPYLSKSMISEGVKKYPDLSSDEVKKKLRSQLAKSQTSKAFNEIFDMLINEKNISNFAKVNNIVISPFAKKLPGELKKQLKDTVVTSSPDWDDDLNKAFSASEKATPASTTLTGKENKAIYVIITEIKSPGIKPLAKLQDVLKKELAEDNLITAAKNKATAIEKNFLDQDFEKSAREAKYIYREVKAWNFSDREAASPFTHKDKIKLFDLKEDETLAPFKVELSVDGKSIKTYAIVSLKEIVHEESIDDIEKTILDRRRRLGINSWFETWGKSINQESEKLAPEKTKDTQANGSSKK